MICDDTAPLMEAWLDSQLDTRTAAEVSAHLDSCPQCAAAFEAARCGNARVEAWLKTPDAAENPSAMWRRIEDSLPAAPAGAPRRRLAFLAGAVVITVVVLAWRMLAPSPENAAPPSLADALRRDHEEFLAGEFGPAFHGPPPAHVLAAAQGRVDAAAFAALPSGADITIEGARLCHLDGVPVAWTLVRQHGQPVSWIALRREELAHFPAMRDALAAGTAIVAEKSGPWHFAARQFGEHVVCALGPVDTAALVALAAR